MLYSLRRFRQSEVAQKRMRIIKFYKEYAEKSDEGSLWCRQKSDKQMAKKAENSGTLS